MKTVICVMMVCLLAAGCTRYEYAVVQPPELSRHIDRDGTVIDEPPLRYHLVSYENRLVIRVENTADQPVHLVGDRSWLVTPDNESRPLLNQTIAPQSHVKLILPPLQPRVTRTGPSVGIGFGVSSGRVGTGVGVGTPLRSRTYVHDDDAYWEWSGETEVRLHLVFEYGGESIMQDFTFLRVRK